MSQGELPPNWDQLRADLERVGLVSLTNFRNNVRKYAGKPDVASMTTRTAIREDSIIQTIADELKSHARPQYRVLDACCGVGGLATHLASNLSEQSARVGYLGIDQDKQNILKARQINLKSRLHQVDFRLGEVWYLPAEWHGSVDLVVLCNTLHELPPSRFPELFTEFNRVLNTDTGHVCVIDMEQLPVSDPEEVAINWHRDEIEAILRAGNLEVTVTSHPKSVGVFRAMIKHTNSVNAVAMLRQIQTALRSKLRRLIAERENRDESIFEADEKLLKWIVQTGSVARCSEELLLVDDRIAEMTAKKAE